MMNDDPHHHHQDLSTSHSISTHQVPISDALFTLDDSGVVDVDVDAIPEEDDDESDLFGRIPNNTTTSSSRGGTGHGLFDSLPEPTRDADPSPPPVVNNNNSTTEKQSFYRSYDDPLRAAPPPPTESPPIAPNDPTGSAIPDSRFYRSHDDIFMRQQQQQRPRAPPPQQPPPPPPSSSSSSQQQMAYSFQNMRLQQQQQQQQQQQHQQYYPSSSHQNSYQQTSTPTATVAWSNSDTTRPLPPPPKSAPPPPPSSSPPTPRPTTTTRPATTAQPHRINPNPEYTYKSVVVTNPAMVETSGFFGGKSGYWTYEVRTEINGRVESVRRRFRNIVALEERIRESRPGVIMPPRPDKNAALPFEEGTMTQSATFAKHRTKLIQAYLSALLSHPLIGRSCNPHLHLFLTFASDLGYAWPECASGTLARISQSLTGPSNAEEFSPIAAVTTVTYLEMDDPDGDLVALVHSERLRIEKVFTAVPKIRASLDLYQKRGESLGATGMELNKLSKDVKKMGDDMELSKSVEMLSRPLLLAGRRVATLSKQLEQMDRMGVFLMEFKRLKNEVAAFDDRRNAVDTMAEKQKEANRALWRLEQAEAESHLRRGGLAQLRYDVDKTEEEAVTAISKAEDVGRVLKGELLRLGMERKVMWRESVGRVARDMKESVCDQVGIWEQALTRFEKEFPYLKVEEADVVISGGKGGGFGGVFS